MSEAEPTFNITIDGSMSINDLLLKQEEGFSVLRSAHIGNLSPYNLTLASVGIPILCVDHNVTGIDKNYFPEEVRLRDEYIRIASLGSIVCRTLVESNPSNGVGKLMNGSTFVDEAHLAALRKIIPETDAVSNTEYLRRNEQIAGEIILLAQELFPNEFNRMVLPDGTVKKTAGSFVDSISTLGIMQLCDNPRAEKEAVLIPNVVDITICAVIEAINTAREEQFHLSGPDMVLYIKNPKIREKIQELYFAIKTRASFGDQLPPALQFKLIPTAAARFATTTLRSPALTTASDIFNEFELTMADTSTDRKTFFTSDQAKDSVAVSEFTAKVSRKELHIRQLRDQAFFDVPELFAAPGKDEESNNFVTQYDVLAEGGLFVAPINLRLSMDNLTKLLKELRKGRPK